MTELISLAPTLAIPLVIVAAAMLLLREVRKLAPNGKLDAVAKQLDVLADRLGDLEARLTVVEQHLAYMRGKLDGAGSSATATGPHRPVAPLGDLS